MTESEADYFAGVLSKWALERLPDLPEGAAALGVYFLFGEPFGIIRKDGESPLFFTVPESNGVYRKAVETLLKEHGTVIG